MKLTTKISGMVTTLVFSTSAWAFPGILGQAKTECGIASHYSAGSLTANGERYDHMAVSAAHKFLPFGTRVIVRHQRNGKSILVRINDRGPFVDGRIIDLSTGAKRALGMDGLAPVCIEVVSYGQGKYVHTIKKPHIIKGNHTVYWSDRQLRPPVFPLLSTIRALPVLPTPQFFSNVHTTHKHKHYLKKHKHHMNRHQTHHRSHHRRTALY
jgi:rare lipoprotein A